MNVERVLAPERSGRIRVIGRAPTLLPEAPAEPGADAGGGPSLGEVADA